MRKQLLLTAGILLASSTAFAERSSFLLSAGGGFSSNSLEIYNPSGDLETEAEVGTVRSLKIGGVIAQQHAIYFHGQSSSFDMNLKGESRTFSDNTSMVLGIGYTYYVNPTVGSIYIEATTGLASFTINDNNTDVDSFGAGFIVGAGYEFNRNIQVGVTYSSVSTDNNDIDSEQSYGQSNIAAKIELKI